MYTRSTRGGEKIKMHNENLLGQKMNKKHYYALLIENNNFEDIRIFHLQAKNADSDDRMFVFVIISHDVKLNSIVVHMSSSPDGHDLFPKLGK